MQVLVLGLVFVGSVLLVLGLYSFLNRGRLAAAAAARSRLRGEAKPWRGWGESDEEIRILRDERASSVGFLDRLLRDTSLSTILEDDLRRSGAGRSVGELVLGSLLCGALAFWFGVVWLPSFAPLLGIAGLMIPYLVVKRLQQTRITKAEDQLPDAIDMMVNALRAGYSLQAAIEFVGREMPAPIGPEFGRVYEEQRLGFEMREALLGLQDRIPSTDYKMLVTSMLIQRETGGNLSEILSNIAVLMRTRQAFRGHLEALTSEPRLSAYVLAALPIGVFLIMTVLNPDYLQPLFTDPRGRAMVLYGIGSLIAGFVLLMKISDVEF